MRELSSREKEIIKRIIETRSFYFRDLFSKFFLDNVRIVIDLPSKEAAIFYADSINEIRDVFEEIVTIIGLIKLLDKNDLILRAQIEIELHNKFELGQFQGDKTTRFIFGDKFIKQELADNVLTEFFVTEELRTFYKDKFRTKEEIRHNQTMNISYAALLLALGTSIYSILNPTPNFNDNFEKVNDGIKTLDNKIDSIKIFPGDRITIGKVDSVKSSNPDTVSTKGNRR